jgi:hypothetical protein
MTWRRPSKAFVDPRRAITATARIETPSGADEPKSKAWGRSSAKSFAGSRLDLL